LELLEAWRDLVQSTGSTHVTDRSELLTMLDDIRAGAIPNVLRYSPVYTRDHWTEWLDEPWWNDVFDVDVIEASEALAPEISIAMICRLSTYFDREEVGNVLRRIEEPAKLHECLEVVLTEGIRVHPDDLGDVMGLVLEHVERAGHRPLELIRGLASELDDVTRFVEGTRYESLDDLVDDLERMVEGETATDEVDSEISAEPTESELRMLLTDAELTMLEGAVIAIKQSSAGGYTFGDPGLWEGQRRVILAEARARWRERHDIGD